MGSTEGIGARLELALARRPIRWLEREMAARGERVGYSTVYRYVKGQVVPPIRWLQEAAEVLGVREPWLILDFGSVTDSEEALGREEDRRKVLRGWEQEKAPADPYAPKPVVRHGQTGLRATFADRLRQRLQELRWSPHQLHQELKREYPWVKGAKSYASLHAYLKEEGPLDPPLPFVAAVAAVTETPAAWLAFGDVATEGVARARQEWGTTGRREPFVPWWVVEHDYALLKALLRAGG